MYLSATFNRVECMRWDRIRSQKYHLVLFCPEKFARPYVVYTVSEVFFLWDRIFEYGLMKRRQVARKLNIRKRFTALTAQEKIVSKRYFKIFCISLFKSLKLNNAESKYKYKKLAQWAYLKYLTEVIDPGIDLPPPQRLDRKIETFSKSQCWMQKGRFTSTIARA